MRLAEDEATSSVVLSLLGLWALLAPVQCSQGHPSWRYISSEVVIPRRHTPRGKGVQESTWLSYNMHFGGQRHIIHVRRKKLFLPRHMPVMSQDDQAALQVDYPYIRKDCYYLGFLEEVPYSMVTIDTCSGGLKGIMKLDDLAYEIKPLLDSHLFEHVVSEIVADTNVIGPTYRLGYKQPPLPKEYTSGSLRISSILYASHTAYIIIKDQPHELEFSPEVNSVCTSSSLIKIGYLERHFFILAIITSLQIGRSIGFSFDTSPRCYCHRRATCIMSRYPVMTDVFSNCSVATLQDLYGVGMFCVFAPLLMSHNLSRVSIRCGNGIKEGMERCDCGSLKQCYSNECCLTSCLLSPGSVCNDEPCCTNCTYTPMGSLCRNIQNVCDLPEYCTGESYRCPDNLYMQDGTPCTEDGYCYQGNCTDRSMHCKEIFGENAVNADSFCYNVNMKGNRFGHCRRVYHLLKHEACSKEDIMCGRLQCTNVTRIPRLQEHVSFHQSVILGLKCFGVDEHRATDTSDVGHVRPGTPCAPGKFCTIGSYCNGTLSELNYDCYPKKCNFRGVCNNEKQCHCNLGWEPPLCLKPGAGGSEHSGTPPRRFRTIAHNEDSIMYLRLLFARMYAFIGAFLFGVATNVKVIQKTAVVG
ncbi:PREDICTED: disintegrin and metalloproteinase domain-containing protein 20-like [Chrysochloris asiatica]|uniref:Disintegrin and metalloproteinase domain-containing protein 20-like n=1 Tax=Chrysochloris asiatica TaxID=185453 RepID=A0A9B0X1B2_CHRAS|nr:PREDICTED: disintegrin and metalloproteinase domain-containing protein 20-like [Chrysochloris asiatica]